MSRPTVVIVDDNAHAAQRLGLRFEEAGWSATLADGRAAFETLATKSHDVVVADLQLVSNDIGKVIDAVLATDPNLSVIVMSSFASTDMAIRAMYRGAYAYVVKPVRFDELSLLATRAVQQHTVRRENEQLRAREAELLVPLREIESHHIRRVLAHCKGNKTRAAEILGIDASTLHRKLREERARDT